jgi:hypothetical protein
MTMLPDPVGETSKQVGTFMRIMEHQPLSLALVVMNFVLLGFLFYSGTKQLSQRQDTTQMIVKWQQDTDKIMASCVSGDIMQMILNALERTQRFGDKPAPGAPIEPVPPLAPIKPAPEPTPQQ